MDTAPPPRPRQHVDGRPRPLDAPFSALVFKVQANRDPRRLSSIAFPAISIGAFGYPMREAARVALGTILETARDLQSVELVRMVLYAPGDLQLHRDVLAELRPDEVTDAG